MHEADGAYAFTWRDESVKGGCCITLFQTESTLRGWDCHRGLSQTTHVILAEFPSLRLEDTWKKEQSLAALFPGFVVCFCLYWFL